MAHYLQLTQIIKINKMSDIFEDKAAKKKKGLELNAAILKEIADSILEYSEGKLSRDKLLEHLCALNDIPRSVRVFM